jgi:hypothetical protein
MRILLHKNFYKLYRNKKQQERIINAIHFYIDEHKMRHYNYTLEILFDEKIFAHERTIALFYLNENRKRGHVGLRKNQKNDELINSIFHEITHFHQFLKGDLYDHRQKYFWRGKSFSKVNTSTDYDTYYNFPWEIEARETATETLKLFNKKYPLSLWDKLCNLWSKIYDESN